MRGAGPGSVPLDQGPVANPREEAPPTAPGGAILLRSPVSGFRQGHPPQRPVQGVGSAGSVAVVPPKVSQTPAAGHRLLRAPPNVQEPRVASPSPVRRGGPGLRAKSSGPPAREEGRHSQVHGHLRDAPPVASPGVPGPGAAIGAGSPAPQASPQAPYQRIFRPAPRGPQTVPPVPSSALRAQLPRAPQPGQPQHVLPGYAGPYGVVRSLR